MSSPAFELPAVRRNDDEPEWLVALRTAARKRVLSDGLPTTRDENFKYTNLRALRRRRFAPPAIPHLDPADVPALAESGMPAVTFVNGCVHERHSCNGLSIDTLSEWLERDTNSLEHLFGTLADAETHPLAALNTACFDEAIVIRLASDQVADVPLLIEYVSAPGTTETLACPRILIDMGANSRLTVIERFAGLEGAANYTNAVTEVFLAAGARLEHYRLQELAETEFATALLRVKQAADSKLVARSVDIGGKLVRNDLHTQLEAPGASARLTGFYMAIGRQHIDNHTRIDHDAPQTTSHEVFHGVLAERARAVFNGKVIVARDAQKVSAQQTNRNLLLSGTPEIDTKPELEIYADDVRCSHGATVGQLDEDALFYLRSRGLGERTARALLTFAFADEVLREFELAELRDYIEQVVAARLPDHERLVSLV